MFETWYEKIAQADPEKQRKVTSFFVHLSAEGVNRRPLKAKRGERNLLYN